MENETNPILDILKNVTENLSNNMNTQNTNDNSNINFMDFLNSIGNKNINSTNNNSSFDLSYILKMQKILSAFNTEDSRKNLLMNIKPFLRISRQNKIDEYVTYLSVITAISAFNKE